MGGRGSSSGMSGGPVSRVMSNIYYNSAKKKNTSPWERYGLSRDSQIEKAIRNQDPSFINSITDKKEAYRVSDYLTARGIEINHKIKKLGSKEAVYKNQKVAKEKRNYNIVSNAMQDKMHQFAERPKPGNLSAMHDPSRTTTTYDRARKRRMKDFDAWFFGSSKK